MFVDDFKVYTKDREGLEKVVRLVEEVSGAMGMELGLRKCVVAHMTQGTIVMSGGIALKSGKDEGARGRSGLPVSRSGTKI